MRRSTPPPGSISSAWTIVFSTLSALSKGPTCIAPKTGHRALRNTRAADNRGIAIRYGNPITPQLGH